MSVWVFHSSGPAGQDALIMPQSDLPDLSDAPSLPQVKRRLRAMDEYMPPETLQRLAERIFRFTHELTKEDIIAVPHGDEVAFAEVTGRVAFVDGVHQRPVKWLATMPLAKFGKYRDIFVKQENWLKEVNAADAKRAIRDALPHTRSRFARWKWVITVVVVIKLTGFAILMWKRETAGF